ncbi:hypothetical protein [Deinococcus aquatilis]|nr:hypothetical protein [Deinococcus aquatilis]
MATQRQPVLEPLVQVGRVQQREQELQAQPPPRERVRAVVGRG